jgi:hypothetical protein
MGHNDFSETPRTKSPSPSRGMPIFPREELLAYAKALVLERNRLRARAEQDRQILTYLNLRILEVHRTIGAWCFDDDLFLEITPPDWYFDPPPELAENELQSIEKTAPQHHRKELLHLR